MGRNKSGRRNFEDARKYGSSITQMLNDMGVRTYGGNVTKQDERIMFAGKKKKRK